MPAHTEGHQITMSEHQFLYEEARHIAKRITDMAVHGGYERGEYQANIDLLRDAIISLTSHGEFGYTKELIELSANMLNQHYLGEKRLKHLINEEELIHHVKTFPTYASGLLNHLSVKHSVNTLIVDSIVKSGHFIKPDNNLETTSIFRILALSNDAYNWCRFAQDAITVNHFMGTGLALRTLAIFDLQTVKDNSSSFAFFAEALETFRPQRYRFEAHVVEVNDISFFNNLMAIGAQSTVHYLIKIPTINFREPFTLHTYLRDYNLNPDTEYLNAIEQGVAYKSDNLYKHLISSLYTFMLSQDCEPFDITTPLSPESIMEVLSLEGAMVGGTKIVFDRKKVEHMLDSTLKLAIEDGDQHYPGLPPYEKALPREILMKSNYYRGLQLEDQLGL
jgi:hypothetical protein